MRTRIPLSLKILIWFFLNLILLAGFFVLLFNAQFSLNLDWFLAGGARERIETVRDLMIGELNVTPPYEWPAVVRRYSAAHHVELALFDLDARPIVGEISELPDEVRARVLGRGEAIRRRPPRALEALSSPPADERPGGEEARPWRWRGPLRALMRTTGPTRYWLLASGRVENPQAGEPLRVVLVARSSSISGGGLIFDPRPWLVLGLGTVVFSLLFWFPMLRGITRSVGQMKQATRQMADGRFDVRVPVRRRDELGALAASINEMAARLDGFVKGQKRFLGDIAHELCSPLARLQMALGILERDATPEQARYASSAIEKAEQIAGLVGELLSFSKASFGALPAVQLKAVPVSDAVAEAIRREGTEPSSIQTNIAPELTVAADRDLLTRAIANVVRNCVHHAGAASPIVIRAAREEDEAVLSIADSGPGVPADELPRIFDAFYRLDTARTRETGGTGLGLAIVKSCVESCRGAVVARNRLPHGLEIILRLPLAPLESKAAVAKSAA